jgi:2-hydroxy-6-oxonona-2,4-dienedioate hydrolase
MADSHNSHNSQSGYVQVDGGKVYYEIGGEGDTLVLSHAGFVDSGMWDSQWAEFTRHYRVIRYDMRGYGKSDPLQGPISRRDDLYHLLKAHGVERAHLLGCSMSGEIVIDFALEHPEMVSSLIPVSAVPSGFEMKGDPPPHLLEMMSAVQQGDISKASELQIRIWVDGPFREPAQVNTMIRQRAAEMNLIAVKNGTFIKADSQPLNPLNPPAATRLKEIRVPTLIIAGALDHPEILRAADVMAGEIKGAKKVILADAAHVPNMEKPEEFNRAVLGFLRAL